MNNNSSSKIDGSGDHIIRKEIDVAPPFICMCMMHVLMLSMYGAYVLYTGRFPIPLV